MKWAWPSAKILVTKHRVGSQQTGPAEENRSVAALFADRYDRRDVSWASPFRFLCQSVLIPFRQPSVFLSCPFLHELLFCIDSSSGIYRQGSIQRLEASLRAFPTASSWFPGPSSTFAISELVARIKGTLANV